MSIIVIFCLKRQIIVVSLIYVCKEPVSVQLLRVAVCFEEIIVAGQVCEKCIAKGKTLHAMESAGRPGIFYLHARNEKVWYISKEIEICWACKYYADTSDTCVYPERCRSVCNNICCQQNEL